MSHGVICGQCPDVYTPDRIEVLDGENVVMTLAELRRNGRDSRRDASRPATVVGGFLGRRAKPRQLHARRGIERLRSYSFRCPEGHDVSGNPGAQLGLAVLGATGAAKTHVLPAIIRELNDMSALRKVGVTLSDPLYPNPKLRHDVTALYRRGDRLPPTPAGAMLGPYGYKLLTRSGAASAHQHSLLLYDVAGEDLGELAKIGDAARFIVLCRAVLVLIDPVDILPTQFDSSVVVSERLRIDAARDIRDGIRVIAEALTEVWELDSSRDLRLPICFAVSKADAVDWSGGYDWAGQTAQVLRDAADGTPLSEALRASSDRTREVMVQMGCDLVVDEIEDRFDPAWIRYASVSATSAMPRPDVLPDEIAWTEHPVPNGVALSVLHLLDLAGAVQPAPSESAL